MRIIGIDPGYAIVGFGIVECESCQFQVIDYGSITTSKSLPMPQRLKEIYDDLFYILDKHKPHHMAIERLYFQNNQKTAIDVAEARGVILLAAQQFSIDIFEYTPLQVKQSITGYGKAVKTQMQEMTKRILHLDAIPKPDDAADALAMAICHGHSATSRLCGLNCK
jgi:crossover junction endodeoxyribonuclease RuvC